MEQNTIEYLARLICSRETSYTWEEAPAEIREDCRESAKAANKHYRELEERWAEDWFSERMGVEP